MDSGGRNILDKLYKRNRMYVTKKVFFSRAEI